MKLDNEDISNQKEINFYGAEHMNLSLDFIAGLIVGEGTFYWTSQKGRNIPAFSLRMHIRDFDLLINVKQALRLNEKVYEYNHGGRHYAFLIVRDFKGLRKIIESIYPRLVGHKLIQFKKWFSGFKEENLEARYSAIYSVFKNKFPELYK